MTTECKLTDDPVQIFSEDRTYPSDFKENIKDKSNFDEYKIDLPKLNNKLIINNVNKNEINPNLQIQGKRKNVLINGDESFKCKRKLK